MFGIDTCNSVKPITSLYLFNLFTCKNLQKQYTVKICNRFSALQTAEETATECYQRFIDANREVTELLIP